MSSEESPRTVIAGFSSIETPHIDDNEAIGNSIINREDFYYYGITAFPEDKSSTVKIKSGRAWGALCKVYYYYHHRESSHSFRVPRLPDIGLEFGVPPSSSHSFDAKDLSFISTIRFLRMFDDYQKSHPHFQESDILGVGIASRRLDYIRGFVSYNIEKLNQT